MVGAHLIHARGAGRATAGRSVAPAENTTSPPGGTCRKWGLGIGCKELARSRALSTGLSIAYLRSLGLPSLFGAVLAQLLDRRVRTRMHGGVARSRKASPYP